MSMSTLSCILLLHSKQCRCVITDRLLSPRFIFQDFKIITRSQSDDTALSSPKETERYVKECKGSTTLAETGGKKKRGRPKKIQVDESVRKSSASNNNQLQNDESSKVEIKKRGRPRKVQAKESAKKSTACKNDQSQNDESSNVEIKKRGRPKKIQVELTNENQNASNKKEPEDISENTAAAATVDYAPDPNPVTLNLTSLTAIRQFPLFHPSYTEYFIATPRVPEIHIPGYSDRLLVEKPKYPSVGTIINATMSAESAAMLQRWRSEMIKKLGLKGFNQYQQELFARGRIFHQYVEEHLTGVTIQPDVVPGTVTDACWNSARGVLEHISDVQAVEERVYHRGLCYGGILDCVARYKGTMMLIDWKTSKKAKTSLKYTYDNPIQVAAYLGAFNYSKQRDFMVDKAMVVVCYEDGQPADAHIMSRSLCIQYWSQWLTRLHAFWRNKLSP